MIWPPIQYGAQGSNKEVVFEGTLSIARSVPFYVFQVDTIPCFPTLWRIHPRRGTPDMKKDAEKRIEKKITESPQLIGTVTKREDGYWLATDLSLPDESVDVVSRSHFNFYDLANLLMSQSGQATFSLVWLLTPLPGSSKCPLEILSATKNGWSACFDFMEADPESWPLDKALEAEAIMLRNSSKKVTFSEWLKQVILGALARGVPANEIRRLSGGDQRVALMLVNTLTQQYRKNLPPSKDH
jgi:hypothetical protein